MGQIVTIDEVKSNMPLKSKYITQEAVDIINNTINEPEFQNETLLKSASLYENILKGTKASIPEYLNAIRFCSYMMTNDSNYTEAYKKVFCDREFVKARRDLDTESSKYAELTSAASRYRQSKLVVEILTVSQVPLDMIFLGERYKALGVLSEVMMEAKLDRDKINAAKELLAATEGADNIKIELDIGVKEDSAVKQLNDQLTQMAAKQHDMLTSGVSTLDAFGSMKVSEDDVLDGEFSESK